MNRVETTTHFVNGAGIFGLCLMQVCAVADATDKEILEVCNKENPSGTSNGWSEVIRTEKPDSMWHDKNKMPVKCTDYPGRIHFLVLC